MTFSYFSDIDPVADDGGGYSIEELLQQDLFRQAYLAANCSSSTLEGAHTMRVSGQIERPGESQEFVVLKRRPDRMLFTIKFGRQDVTFGVSEGIVWRRFSDNTTGQDSYAILEGNEAEIWAEQSRFFDRIISSYTGEGQIRNLELDEWSGKPCVKVTVTTGSQDSAADILVDPDSLLPILERVLQEDGSIQQTSFSDFRLIDGMQVPYAMETQVAGEVLSRVVLESVTINGGVLSELFELPEELREL